MSVKTTSVTYHGGDSRDKDCVAIIFVMITVMYVSMASRASSVVGRCSSSVIGVIFLDDYQIVEGAKWGSRARGTRVVQGLRNHVRLLSRSLNGGRKRR